MRISPKTKKYLPIIIVLSLVLISGALAGVFFIRSPVLIITDSSFNLLYGPERLRERQRQTSISLFRRVIPVIVYENAGPDLVALVVEEVSSKPRAALFPFRYLDGALLYKENNPDVPVLLMGGRNPVPLRLRGLGIIYVQTDTLLDIYRAVLSAAVFAGEKNILIFDDYMLPEERRELLKQILESAGHLNELLFQYRNTPVNSPENIGCIIVAGPAARFLEQDLDIPVILFSWADPYFTPQTVKLIFDDSPWALAVAALRSGGFVELSIPSAPVILSERVGEKRDFRRIRGIIKENL